MAELSEKYQCTYLREYAKEAEKNALMWISTDDYLAECLDIHEQCHLDYSLQQQLSPWPFMMHMKHSPELLGCKTAIRSNDMESLHLSLRQSAMIKHVTQGVDSGCDHSINVWTTLEILVAGLLDRVPLLLPEKLGMGGNGHLVNLAMTNLMMVLWYKRADFAVDARKRAQKVLTTKQTVSDMFILRYLMAPLDEDVTEAGTQLDLYCISVSALREPGLTKLHKMFWLYAHGLYNLAYVVLGKDKASAMPKPTAERFMDDLAEWQNKHSYRHDPLFVEYPKPIDLINTLVSCTPPECRLHQPYLDTDKKYKNTRYLYADLFEQQMIKIILENMNSQNDKAR